MHKKAYFNGGITVNTILFYIVLLPLGIAIAAFVEYVQDHEDFQREDRP